MKFEVGLINSLESLVKIYLDSVSTELDSFIELDTAVNDVSFATKNGYLCTIIKIDGNIVEDDDYVSFRKRTDMLAEQLKGFFDNESHLLHFVYRRDIGKEKGIIAESVEPARKRAKELDIELDDLFDSQVEYLSRKVIDENVYLALWTNTKVMTSNDFQRENDQLTEVEKQVPMAKKSQSVIETYEKVKRQHDEFISTVGKSLISMDVSCHILNKQRAANTMSKAISPFVDKDFEFIFPDNEYFARRKIDFTTSEKDASHLLWPSISEQIIPEENVEIDTADDVVQIGDYLFTTFEVHMPPRNLVLFNDLADKIGKNVPVQISFFLDSAISFSFFWKKMLSNFPFPASNSRLKKTIAATDKLKLVGAANTEYKLSVSTWSNDYNLLLEHKEHLKSAVTRWGSARVRNYRGCPLRALTDSIQGLTSKTFGGTVYAPLSGVLPQLPLSRRVSLWTKSALTLMGSGGKAFPYAPTSTSLQRFWNIGVLATMGSGKSVLLQSIALTHMLSNSPSNQMPMVGYLDVGFSAKGVINTLRSLSPKSKKDLFMHVTLQNSVKHAYNIHDTQLGCRFPESDQSKFIVNFYLTLLTPIGESKPQSDLEGILTQAVADAYRSCSDDEKPKEYVEGRSKLVDEVLKKHGISGKGHSYWELVDMVFDKKDFNGASRVQRYATPLITDVIKQLNVSDSIKNNYSEVTLDGSRETLINYTMRQLTLAIDTYPILSKPTELNVEHARFIVLDLNDVAKGKGDSGKKTTSIFYVLGRFIVTRNFFVTEDLLNYTPERYRKYHEKRVGLVKSIPKLLVYDEFHRVGWLQSIVAQIMEEMREGRKWNLSVLMASQLVKDFSDDMRDLMSSEFILSNDAGDPDYIRKRYGLNSYLFKYFMSKCTGPDGENGTPLIAKIKLKKKVISQSLSFIISPVLYWITTSDGVDSAFKDYIVNLVGGRTALKLLSKKYPYGVRGVVEEISNSHPDESVKKDPFRFLANEIAN